jgi:hypothetical protein
VCRKKIAAETKNPPSAEAGRPPTDKPQLRCYGCGQPGVIFRNCQTCSKRTEFAFNAIDFEQHDRPIIDIIIEGVQGTAIVDSGARTSLAGPKLQKLVEERHFPFKIQTAKITLADGHAEWCTIKTTTVPVTLKGRTFETPFLCTSQGPDAVTLLGIYFAKNASDKLQIKLHSIKNI